MSRTAPPLRHHQAEALEVLGRAWSSGRRRAWVVLPPGAGKTRVGLETVAESLAGGRAVRAVVLAPNTAIQAQWVRAATEHGLDAGVERDLSADVTCLTYQSLAVFDADAEVDDDASPESSPALVERLHPNGRALVQAMHDVPGLLLVLDECHHLLEVWGRLLEELLGSLESAQVLGLTATPPDALTRDQARLVTTLFADVVYSVGVPAVVKEGHLAPFAELAWLTTPTAHEEEWLALEGVRWQELVTRLTDPSFGSVPFLEWMRARFVTPVPHQLSWVALANADPELTDAALRLAHAGLLDLPVGARVREQHRRPPDADDWVVLLDDWATTHLLGSADPRDREAVEQVRAALPSVGHLLTRRGVRRGRTPVDRVLARSAAKTRAAVEIVAHEHAALGGRARVLVLCDHERASATLPTGLADVIDVQSGSAYGALEALLRDPRTAALDPLLVTGSTVAGAPLTLVALADHATSRDPGLAGRLEVRESGGPVAELVGPWTSRTWVRPVTEFFESGQTQVLVGTRGLLGEGWDARRISGLVDLTTATTLTAVVQTRGRALRTDPTWPDKVAVNWSVVCVSDSHPKGGNDWARLVRKHEGFHGVDADGDVVDGVSHIDPVFSPYSAPSPALFDDVNARMRARAADRDAIREAWRVGEPYADTVAPTVRVVHRRTPVVVEDGPPVVRIEPRRPGVLVTANGVEVRDPDDLVPPPEDPWETRTAGLLGMAGAATVAATPLLGWPALSGLAVVAAGATQLASRRSDRARAHRELAEALAGRAMDPPPVPAVAAAVADALREVGAIRSGHWRVVVEVHPGGEHRCRLDASEQYAQVYAEALEEALGPVEGQRYLVSRPVLLDTDLRWPADLPWHEPDAVRAAVRGLRPSGVVWHPVPAVLGARASSAAAYLEWWRHWVGDGEVVYTGSPEGAGVLAAQHGTDPFDVTTAIRRHWL